MTKEQAFFLEMLRDHLMGVESAPSESIDWDEILHLSSIHQMTMIVYHQCISWLRKHPELNKQTEILTSRYAEHLSFRMNHIRSYQIEEEKLCDKKIDFLVFKGEEIAQYYPQPIYRNSTDADILVHSSDMISAHDVFVSDGYEAVTERNADWTFKRPDSSIELHDKLLYDVSTNTTEGVSFCEKCWENASQVGESSRYILDWNFHFIYLLLHIRKHIMFSGVGFRQFYDLAVLINCKKINFDWNKITKELAELNILSFSQKCLGLCEKWFSVKNPLMDDLIDDSFFSEITSVVFANGAYGCHNEDNKVNMVSNYLGREKKSYFERSLRLLAAVIFPSYQNMREAPAYSFLDNRPWLLPIAWLYRWGYVTVTKFSHGIQKIMIPFGKKSAVEKRESFLEKWDL